MQVTVKHAGEKFMILAGKILYPGETRTVNVKIAALKDRERPGELKPIGGDKEFMAAWAELTGAEESKTEDDTPPKPAGSGAAKTKNDQPPLSGMTFVIAGKLPSMTKAEAETFIRENGGQIAKEVSGKVNCLVAGENPGDKREQAQKAGLLVVDEDGLKQLAQQQ